MNKLLILFIFVILILGFIFAFSNSNKSTSIINNKPTDVLEVYNKNTGEFLGYYGCKGKHYYNKLEAIKSEWSCN